MITICETGVHPVREYDSDGLSAHRSTAFTTLVSTKVELSYRPAQR